MSNVRQISIWYFLWCWRWLNIIDSRNEMSVFAGYSFVYPLPLPVQYSNKTGIICNNELNKHNGYAAARLPPDFGCCHRCWTPFPFPFWMRSHLPMVHPAGTWTPIFCDAVAVIQCKLKIDFTHFHTEY